MVEGDSFNVILTVKGTLTKNLHEFLKRTYPDDSIVIAIQNCIADEIMSSGLGEFCEIPEVSYTLVDPQTH